MRHVSIFMLRLVAAAVAMAAVALSAQSGGGAGAGDSRPDVIVIVVNDLRWDEIGSAGHPFLQTPHIDRLAREGAYFPNAFVTVPHGSASFAGLLNGRHPAEFVEKVSPDAVADTAFPRKLRDAGYRTAFIGHWPFGAEHVARAGFTDWVYSDNTYNNPRLLRPAGPEAAKGYVTDVLVEQATQFISRKENRPFCLVLAHHALSADSAGGEPAAIPAERHRHLYADVTPRHRPGPEVLQRPAAGGRAAKPGGTPEENELIRMRWRALAAIDEGVGRIIEALQAGNRFEDTLIIFTSDQGYLYKEHGLKGPAAVAYEEAIRVPLVVHHPKRVKRGTAPTNLVLNIDVAPTVLELAGVEAPAAIAPPAGLSLGDLLRGQSSAWRFSFLIEGSAARPGASQPLRYQAVRTPAWKYIRFLEGGGEELYDLHADHYELINLAGRKTASNELRRWSSELAKVLRSPAPKK